MELPLVAPAPVVGYYATVFRDLGENPCQFRHFQHYLTGLMVPPNKSMAHKACCILDSADKTNHSSCFFGSISVAGRRGSPPTPVHTPANRLLSPAPPRQDWRWHLSLCPSPGHQLPCQWVSPYPLGPAPLSEEPSAGNSELSPADANGWPLKLPAPQIAVKERHVMGKAYTHAIERDASPMNHHLARMTRRTKVVSKSDAMMHASLKLWRVLTVPEIFAPYQALFLSIFN